MRNLQFQLASHWDRRDSSSHLVPMFRKVLEDLQWWSDPVNLLQGQSLEVRNPELFLFTDAS